MGEFSATLKMSFRELIAFRMDFYFIFVGLPTRILVLWLLWDFLLQDQTQFASIPRVDIFAFVTFNAFLQWTYAELDNTAVMEHELVSGKAVVDMTIPIDYHRLHFYKLLPAQIILFVVGITILFVISSLGVYQPKLSALMVIALLINIGLALVMNYYLMSILATLAITYGWVSKLKWTIIQLFAFLGGLFVPLSVFPFNLTILRYINPISTMYDLPASIFVSIIDFKMTTIRIAIALGWVLIFFLAHTTLWKRGLERFTAPGG